MKRFSGSAASDLRQILRASDRATRYALSDRAVRREHAKTINLVAGHIACLTFTELEPNIQTTQVQTQKVTGFKSEQWPE